MSEYYNLAKIRQLLSDGFSKEDLLTLCFDQPLLRSVYEDFEASGAKSELVRALLDHAYRQLSLDVVLAWAKGKNQKRYALYQPYSRDEDGEQSDDAETAVSMSIIDDNKLGYGAQLGGEFQSKPLRIAATAWTPYGLFREVRSGWLFVPQFSEGHAVAFFKIHVAGDGSGYVHLTDVASPEHKIWFATTLGLRKEALFHYVTKPVELWEFRWR